MAESKLADLSMDFAVNILKLCDGIKGRRMLIASVNTAKSN